MNLITQTESNNQGLLKKKNDTIQERLLFLKTNRMIKKFLLSDIDFFEAESNSTRCFIKEESFLLRIQLKDIENMLPKGEFVRIHKSYIIPIRKIDRIVKHIVYINEVPLPIGVHYRKVFYTMLPSYF